MTATAPAPKRIGVLVPGADDLITAGAQLIREASHPEEFLVTYERATGEVGDGADPRGPEDPIRFVAAAGHVHKLRGHRRRLSWRVGVSPEVPYGAEPGVLVDAMTDAIAALLKDLTGDDAAIAALRR